MKGTPPRRTPLHIYTTLAKSKSYPYVTARGEYVSKCKWYMYMYVKKRVQLDMRGTVLQKITINSIILLPCDKVTSKQDGQNKMQ